MIWLLMSLILGILPQSLYFTLFITEIKQIKDKRKILCVLTFIICTINALILQYNLYLYLLIIPCVYKAMKILYKKKTQIIDIFIIALAFGYLSVLSYLCSLIYKNNMSLYWIAYIINNVLLFAILLFKKYMIKGYRFYISQWNRKPGNKFKSISIRNVSLILLNVFIVILDIIIINNLK